MFLFLDDKNVLCVRLDSRLFCFFPGVIDCQKKLGYNFETLFNKFRLFYLTFFLQKYKIWMRLRGFIIRCSPDSIMRIVCPRWVSKCRQSYHTRFVATLSALSKLQSV